MPAVCFIRDSVDAFVGSVFNSSAEWRHLMNSLDAARQALGLKRLVLQIHDTSFPSHPDEDTGRGSPYSNGARDFFAFTKTLGFDGVQFGPQGQTSRGNKCPYDGRLFPNDFLSVALAPLVHDPYWRGLLPASSLERIVGGRPNGNDRSHHTHAWDEVSSAIDEAFATFRTRAAIDEPIDRDFAEFVNQNANWLVRDGGQGQTRHAFVQFILHQQRHQLRENIDGLRLYGDLQVGMGPDDARQFASLFHPDYRIGAPPSRTNPEGQPWGYAVFHPEQVASGAAGQFLKERLARMLDGLDGLRIDHPHGLVCPWVYKANTGSDLAAVRSGARFYESFGLPDHPELAQYAIARVEQINEREKRHADRRTFELDDEQVARFSILFDIVIDSVRAAGGDVTSDIACEVLSTLPYPLERVMQRHGLGRFRVIQKAQLDKPDDVYRIENSQSSDWIMMGNHDTPSIWLLARGWCDGSRGVEWAEYLAERLLIPSNQHDDFIRRTSREPGQLVQAIFTAMLASRASHVSVFFPDVFGITGFYNMPGIVNETNWTLRVPPNFAAVYEERRRRGEALDVAWCLQRAAEARVRGESVVGS